MWPSVMAVNREDVQQLAHALSVLQEGMNRAVRQREKAGELRLLFALARTPSGARPSEIADALGVDRSLVTRQLRDLEDQGKVEVSPDPRDGRAFIATLTEAGKNQTLELMEFGLRRYESFLTEWEPEEVHEFVRLLWKFEHSKAAVAAREQQQHQPERPRERRRR